MSAESGVAYQNKDIAAKYLEEHLANKTFAVYYSSFGASGSGRKAELYSTLF